MRVFIDKRFIASYLQENLLSLSQDRSARRVAATEQFEGCMRRIRYAVAASLDGYIAGPEGEVDWITMDTDIDFSSIFNQFDTLFVGRRTFESMAY